MNSFIYKSKYLNRVLFITHSQGKIRSLSILPMTYKGSLDHSLASNLIIECLDAYFIEGKSLKPLIFNLEGTLLQKKVWMQLMKIPFSKTISYAELAGKVGYPRAVRAVASAVGKNPIPVLIPCHRVIRSSGEIGQYSGGAGIKKKLLAFEQERMHSSRQ